MCGAAYTLAGVTGETKIHGVAASGEAPPTGGRSGRRWGKRGGTYMKEREIGTDLCGDILLIGFWYPRRMCVFNVCVVDTDTESYDGRYQIFLS